MQDTLMFRLLLFVGATCTDHCRRSAELRNRAALGDPIGTALQVHDTTRSANWAVSVCQAWPGGYRWLDTQPLTWMKNPLVVPLQQVDTDGNRH